MLKCTHKNLRIQTRRIEWAYVFSYKNDFRIPSATSMISVIIVGAVARRRFGKRRKCRDSYRRDSKHHVERDFDSSRVGKREKNVIKGRTCWGSFQVARTTGENYKRRHSGSIGVPSIEKYFSKRLSKLFAHLVRRRKYLSIELIIDKIASAKKSAEESDERKRFKYTKY